MLKDLSVNDYIEMVDSDLPAPGGGSVAALVGALGVSLNRMLGHFSITKKKFLEAKEERQTGFLLVFEQLKGYKENLVDGIDHDALAYRCVVEAYKSKDEKEIERAMMSAAYVSFEIQVNAFKALESINELIELGNKNVMSDLLAGAILLNSCVEISNLNVQANAKLLNDASRKNYYSQEGNRLMKEAAVLKENIVKLVQ